MPYVTPERRAELRPPQYTGRPPATMSAPGDLAYLLAASCADYLRQHGTSWTTISTVIGQLEGVKLDLWSRVGGPYEAAKAAQNGGLYERR